MKTSSAAAPPKRSAAMNCLLVNQFATPWLGSLMGRRFIEGTVQLLLALVGFIFFVGWFIQICERTYRMASNLPELPDRYPWMGKVGLILFAAAWLLSWVTSLSLLKRAREAEAQSITVPRPRPPKI